MNSELLQSPGNRPSFWNDRLADVLIADGLIKAVEHQISEWSADIQLRDCRDWFWAQGWWICTATLESQGLKKR